MFNYQFALDHLYSNYDRITHPFTGTYTKEWVDEAVSNVTVTLLKNKPDNIVVPDFYIKLLIKQELGRLIKKQNRFVENSDIVLKYIPDSCIFERIETEQDHQDKLNLMYSKIKELAPKQRAVLEGFLKLGKTSLVPGNPMTNKSNFRYARENLKRLVGL